MALMLGTTKVNIPFARAYLGNTLVYVKETGLTEFISCPFPTTWTVLTGVDTTYSDRTDMSSTHYESVNDYGTWYCYANTIQSDSSTANAFDQDDETYYASFDMYEVETIYDYYITGIKLPDGVAINPSKFYIKYGSVDTDTNGNIVYGKNIETGEFESLFPFILNGTDASGVESINKEIITENYYSEFKIVGNYASTIQDVAKIYEFQIQEGIIKTYAPIIVTTGFIPTFDEPLPRIIQGFKLSHIMSSVSQLDTHKIYKLFDGDDSTYLEFVCYSIDKGMQNDIIMEFPRSIKPIDMCFKMISKMNSLTYKILLSNDGTTYDEVYSINPQGGTSKTEVNETITIDMPLEYKYMKLSVTSSANLTNDSTIYDELYTLQITKWEEV